MEFKEDNIGNILGIIVNVFSLISDGSQIYHSIKYQKTDGISIIHLICEIIIGVTFLLYGLHLKLLMIITLNCSYLLCITIMLYYWIYNYRMKNRGEETYSIL